MHKLFNINYIKKQKKPASELPKKKRKTAAKKLKESDTKNQQKIVQRASKK